MNNFSVQDIKTLKKIYEYLLSKNKFEFASLILKIISGWHNSKKVIFLVVYHNICRRVS